jgi:predicted RNase H-like nuclease (RuvC/YqgF family)
MAKKMRSDHESRICSLENTVQEQKEEIEMLKRAINSTFERLRIMIDGHARHLGND